jgi:hypothetical protein
MSALPVYVSHNAADLHFTISHLSIGVAHPSDNPPKSGRKYKISIIYPGLQAVGD